jgi:hypothetical protein
MGAGNAIRQDSRIAVTVEGHDFLVYRWCAGIALEALGQNALGVVNDQVELKAGGETLAERYAVIEKALKVLMISPRLVDNDTDDPDEVTWRDLQAAGDLGAKLFGEVTRRSAERAANFPAPSEGQEGR